MRTDEPNAVHLKDYRAPDYRISEVALDFSLDPVATRVAARMRVTRIGSAGAPLVLNGEAMKLVSVAIDGHRLKADQYALEPALLTIPDVPEKFILHLQTWHDGRAFVYS